MGNRNIIIISHDPLTYANVKSYFIDELSADGFTVKYLCVRNIIGYANGYRVHNELNHPVISEVITKDDMMGFLDHLTPENTLVWLDIWFRPQSFFIFRELNRRGILYFNIDWWLNALHAVKRAPLQSKISILKPIESVNKIFEALYLRLAKPYSRLIGAEDKRIVFLTGRLTAFKGRGSYRSLNHYNLEEFNAAGPVNINDCAHKPIVFIDTYLPSHPDIKRIKQSSIDPVSYYSKMRAFFTYLEKRYSREVVVAAHPKAKYDHMEFGNRKIVYGATLSLVKNSYFVVQHHSAAINYAILSMVPIVLAYTNEFLNRNNQLLSYTYNFMDKLSEELDLAMINIDNVSGDYSLNLEVNEQLYHKYTHQYLLSETNERSNYKILTDFFMETCISKKEEA